MFSGCDQVQTEGFQPSKVEEVLDLTRLSSNKKIGSGITHNKHAAQLLTDMIPRLGFVGGAK
jgi:hypothetical protein